MPTGLRRTSPPDSATKPRPGFTKEIRGLVEQFLRLVVRGYVGHVRGPTARAPFVDSASGFFVI
ncbi:MAG TPA: hypothetical protein VMF50_00345 [Candidatus Binataceae bacterium]|nr:hypothetical protein [Candidatus Binataceae bacterium]